MPTMPAFIRSFLIDVERPVLEALTEQEQLKALMTKLVTSWLCLTPPADRR